MRYSGLLVSALAGVTLGYDQWLGFRTPTEYETRSIDEIYAAALAEGGVVTLWHGGDEKYQQDRMKAAFEARFPGMKLNSTVDLSKYHDVRVDEQLANGRHGVYVDSIILQTMHDYPRWAADGALLNYAPLGFEAVHDAFKDIDAAWYGVYVISWSGAWNNAKLPGIAPPVEYTDFLKPEFKDKLVLTYPNDDDAVLFAYHLILTKYGSSWFTDLLKQNPRWVRGTATPSLIAANSTQPQAAFFGTGGGSFVSTTFNVTHPTQGNYVSWPQRAAILKDAPHKEGAKLLHNFLLSAEYQGKMKTWSVRRDIAPPAGFPDLWNETQTSPTEFEKFMVDRAKIERLRFWFESRIGTPKGLDPIDDDI